MLEENKYSNIAQKFEHENCILCGPNNKFGLHLSFVLANDGSISTELTPSIHLQGYKGILHGGVIAALMDCAMVNCLFHNKIKAVTAELTTKYVHSIPIDKKLLLTGKIEFSKHGLYKTYGEISVDGKVMAKANAKFKKI